MSQVRTLSQNPVTCHVQAQDYRIHDWSKERSLYFDGSWWYTAQCCDAILGPDKLSAPYVARPDDDKLVQLGGGNGGVEEREGGYEIRYGGYPSCATLGCKYQMYSEGEGRYYWHAAGCTYWLPEGRRKPVMGIRDRLKQCQESGCYPAYSESGDEITWIHSHGIASQSPGGVK